MKADLLLEILTEELPTQAVTDLSASGGQLLEKICAELQLNHRNIEVFQTPRRLAWRINQIDKKQHNQTIKKKGPALNSAKDADGHWTKSASGFAQSNGVSPDDLVIEDGYLYYVAEKEGQTIQELFPFIFKSLTDNLPIAKRMRWGDYEQSFVRPVLAIVALLDDEILNLEYFGIKAGRETLGHRVHAPSPIVIKHAKDYESALLAGSVIVSLDERKRLINQQIQDKAQQLNAVPVVKEALLHEVASLVEYPVAIVGDFEPEFLEIPQEVLITTMQDNQKTFALTNASGKMLPHFIAIANLKSLDEKVVKKGNEKVIRPRFADAKFFWEQDLKRPLSAFSPKLSSVAYIAKLGSLADKTARLVALGDDLSPLTGAKSADVVASAELAKCDLLSEMVMEFPELQGVMGKYYAQKQGLNDEIAQAIEEQYFPLGSGGALPSTKTGLTLALAEKLDILVGGFAIGAKPTGSKDPYSLRRQAISLIRLLIENQLSVNIRDLLEKSASLLNVELKANDKISEIYDYIIERLEHYYKEQGIKPETYQAIKALQLTDLLDFERRIQALHQFLKSDNLSSLLESAKRIRNILRKNGENLSSIQSQLLVENAEQALFEAFNLNKNQIEQFIQEKNYLSALNLLTHLAQPLDDFFTHVMVMSDDERLKNNRLALLTTLQNQFNLIADLSVL